MSKETKFGYGFLFVGVGLPYLVERMFGPLTAAFIALAFLVVGVILLIAGHRHRDKQTSGGSRVNSHRHGLLVLAILLVVAIIVSTAILLRKHWESGFHASRSAVSPVEALSNLGWAVTPTKNGQLEFSISQKELPDMRASSREFRLLNNDFSVRFSAVNSVAGLANLEGITHLNSLTLDSVKSADFGDLRRLDSLVKLDIRQSGIKNLFPIANLQNLRALTLENDSALRNISSIANLRELAKLDIMYTPVSDLAPLRNLKSLKSLFLVGTKVASLSPLIGLDGLRELTIDGSSSSELYKLSKSHITTLSIISYRYAVNTAYLGDLPTLNSLEIMASNKLDLNPLAKLERLSKLSILGTSVSWKNLNPSVQVEGQVAIGRLRALKILVLAHIAVRDISFLSKLSELKELTMNWLPVADIRPIENLKGLQKVNLVGDPVVDISPLLNLPNLTEVGVQQSPARSDVLALLERRGVTVKIN